MGVLRGVRPPFSPSRAASGRAGPCWAKLGLVGPSLAELGRAEQRGGAWTLLRTYRPAGHRAKSP